MRIYKYHASMPKEKYTLPRIDDTVDALCGLVFFFPTLDLLSGYCQIEIEESDKNKTTFVCEFGQYEINSSPQLPLLHL